MFLSILFNCDRLGTMNMKSDGLESTPPGASCSLLKLITVSEFSLVLLQTTNRDHLNSAVQGLCQCARVSLFEAQLTLHFLFATSVENKTHAVSLLTDKQSQNIPFMDVHQCQFLSMYPI